MAKKDTKDEVIEETVEETPEEEVDVVALAAARNNAF